MTTLPDSGDRTEFATGAVRDIGKGKGLPSEIPPIALTRLARHCEAGAKKYGIGNFRKGIPLSRLYDSAFRHLLAASQGDNTEDHLAAVLWNVSVWMWTDAEISAGRLPADLNDLPYQEKPAVDECWLQMDPGVMSLHYESPVPRHRRRAQHP